MTNIFPFAALVGLEPLTLALRLAAIDPRLSVLLRGDKGAGKSTAARALGELLPEGAALVNLPVGATEDRVLGGLDVDRAMRGEPALKPGLLARAHGGVLYVDEVNLLPDHLADAMLDACASGVHIVEREGYSARQDASFTLVGSMNPEEGAVRPQLLDRFAFVVDVSAPMDAGLRHLVVERRLQFEADPEAFAVAWRARQQVLAESLHEARCRVARVGLDDAVLSLVSERVCAHGVRSLRADLAVVRGSRALAALEGRSSVDESHVEAVLPLALVHRVPPGRPWTPPPPTSSGPSETPPAESGDNRPVPLRVFEARPVTAPRVIVGGASAESGTTRGGLAAGPVLRATRAADPVELDARATLVDAAVRHRASGLPGTLQISREHLHEKVRVPAGGRRFVFVVDASGSHAVDARMQLVKGAVEGLLDRALRRHDEVAVVAFRGTAAEIAVPPTTSVDEARAALAYLPTGGRTPLAHALELAAGLVTGDTVVVLLTDGRANVATTSGDPWADALAAAARLACPMLVVDSESGPQALGRARQLAEHVGARHLPLASLDQIQLVSLMRPATTTS